MTFSELRFYFKQFTIAFDQLLNTLTGGWCDETLSARCYRLQHKHRIARYSMIAIDALFFWQDNHCFDSYINEMHRKHLPIEYR